MAALYRLPVIFVCENNLLRRVHLPGASPGNRRRRRSGQRLWHARRDRRRHGRHSLSRAAAAKRIARARRGEGPSLLECKTYRFYDHVGVTGMRIPYREQAEVDAWKARDPIAALELHLVERGVIGADAIAVVHREVLDEIADAIAFAEASPLPDVAALTDDVYSNPILLGTPHMTTTATVATEARPLPFVRAIPEAIAQMHARRPRRLPRRRGRRGVRRACSGRRGDFSTSSVLSASSTRRSRSPRSSAWRRAPPRSGCGRSWTSCSWTSSAVCMDQLINQLAKMKYMFGGKARLPVTILTAAGAGTNSRPSTARASRRWCATSPASRWSCRPTRTTPRGC